MARQGISLYGKMMLILSGASVVVFAAALGYVIQNMSRQYIESVQTEQECKATNIINRVESEVNVYTSKVQTMANILAQYERLENVDRRKYFIDVLQTELGYDNSAMSLWTLWNPGALDGLDDEIDESTGEPYGTFRVAYKRNGFNNVQRVPVNPGFLTGRGLGFLRDTNKVSIVGPYTFQYSHKKGSVNLLTIAAPIMQWDSFVGTVGMDFDLCNLADTLKSISKANNFNIYLSADSLIVYHPDTTLVCQYDSLVMPDGCDTLNYTTFNALDMDNKMANFYFSPIYLDHTDARWKVMVSSQLRDVYSQTNKYMVATIVIVIIGIIVMIILMSMLCKEVSSSLVRINNRLGNMSLGILAHREKRKVLFHDEISSLADALDTLVDGLFASVDFANEIGKGNLEAEYKLLSDDDTLGKSLMAMQKSLKNSQIEKDKKKKLDDQRNWINHGLAEFGDLIRQDNSDMNIFAANVLSELIKYCDMAQGAIYLRADEMEYSDGEGYKYECKAAIAYGKQIMLEKVIDAKDSILGQAVVDQKVIYLENVPERYVTLNQGTKESARPRNLLVVPMVVNDVTFGAVELVSYKPIEQYCIDFVSHLCENIASVISSINTNKNNELLLEKSKYQKEELEQHEEEMQQNLEEMRATQEESDARQSILMSQISSYYRILNVAELDTQGRITNISSNLADILGLQVANARGVLYSSVTTGSETERREFEEDWAVLLQNESNNRLVRTTVRNKKLWLSEHYFVVHLPQADDRIFVVVENQNAMANVEEKIQLEIESRNEE